MAEHAQIYSILWTRKSCIPTAMGGAGQWWDWSMGASWPPKVNMIRAHSQTIINSLIQTGHTVYRAWAPRQGIVLSDWRYYFRSQTTHATDRVSELNFCMIIDPVRQSYKINLEEGRNQPNSIAKGIMICENARGGMKIPPIKLEVEGDPIFIKRWILPYGIQFHSIQFIQWYRKPITD